MAKVIETGITGPRPKIYIGDGAYVSYDGVGFKLEAPRGIETHMVYLEPDVLRDFLRYVEAIRPKWINRFNDHPAPDEAVVLNEPDEPNSASGSEAHN